MNYGIDCIKSNQSNIQTRVEGNGRREWVKLSFAACRFEPRWQQRCFYLIKLPGTRMNERINLLCTLRTLSLIWFRGRFRNLASGRQSIIIIRHLSPLK